jgi:filamentous hemagglutinin family protein
MIWPTKLYRLVLFSSCLFYFVSSDLVLAQIAPDNSLGKESSIVTPDVAVKDGVADLISGGAIRDNNLFHSFSKFNISNGDRVYFANPDRIANILTRVTGNKISEIFGTLGVDGTANLFLLNPKGIVFGKNAKLDVNGSFLATTADSFVFNNGFAYSASNPETPPLLTVNMPVGLQFGNKAKTIVNQSQTGLKSQPQQNLSLIGGNLFLEGGKLKASAGRIELGSVAPNSSVKINENGNNWTLDYQAVQTFQDISLSNNALVSTSGDGGGDINIYGKQIRLTKGSSLESNTLEENHGGRVNLNASESINVNGVGEDRKPSGIFAKVLAEGNGSQININTNSLRLEDGAIISTGVSGAGKGGNLSIQAQDIEIVTANLNFEDSQSNSTLSLSVGEEGKGDGGDLNINADRLFVQDSNIYVRSYDSGNAGKATLNVRDMEVTGSFAFINLTSYGTGSGGNFVFNGDRFIVSNGGFVDASSRGMGDSGNIEINTKQLQIKDNAAQIDVAGDGTGKIGNLTARASESVEISGIGVFPIENDQLGLFSSGIFTSVEAGATADGGILTIETPVLKISNGGKIAANVVGTGTGGKIFIRANTIEVIDTVVDDIGIRSGITSVLESGGTGTGGNIDIIANDLRLIDGGAIFVDSKGTGASGNLNIQAKNIEVDGISSGKNIELDDVVFEQQPLPSQISALSNTDFAAGNLTINTNNLNVRNGGLISVGNTNLGDAGNLSITADTIRLENGGSFNAKVNAGNQGNINLITNNIFLKNKSEINAQATETATGGNIAINNTDNIVLLENSQIIASAIQGNGGNINLTTQGLFVFPDSLISASSQFGVDGNVKVDTINGDRQLKLNQLPENPIDVTKKITKGCGVGNNFAVVGNGGLPENPTQTSISINVWTDLRSLPIAEINNNKKSNHSLINNKPSVNLIEAQNWKVNSQGNIELFTANNAQGITQQDFTHCHD